MVVLEFIGFPCGSDGKESAHNSADLSSLGGEDPLEKEMATHTSNLENSMDRGAWWATVHRGLKESDSTE